MDINTNSSSYVYVIEPLGKLKLKKWGGLESKAVEFSASLQARTNQALTLESFAALIGGREDVPKEEQDQYMNRVMAMMSASGSAKAVACYARYEIFRNRPRKKSAAFTEIELRTAIDIGTVLFALHTYARQLTAPGDKAPKLSVVPPKRPDADADLTDSIKGLKPKAELLMDIVDNARLPANLDIKAAMAAADEYDKPALDKTGQKKFMQLIIYAEVRNALAL